MHVASYEHLAISDADTAYLYYVTHHLTIFSQGWYEAVGDGFLLLANEVQALTHGHARLHACSDPLIEATDIAWHAIPLEWEMYTYGTLQTVLRPYYTSSTLISIAIAQQLADVCSWLLYVHNERQALHSHTTGEAAHLLQRLTLQQQVILHMLSRPLSDKDIAHTLGLAIGTVRRHMSNIYARLGIHSRSEARILSTQLEHMRNTAHQRSS